MTVVYFPIYCLNGENSKGSEEGRSMRWKDLCLQYPCGSLSQSGTLTLDCEIILLCYATDNSQFVLLEQLAMLVSQGQNDLLEVTSIEFSWYQQKGVIGHSDRSLLPQQCHKGFVLDIFYLPFPNLLSALLFPTLCPL